MAGKESCCKITTLMATIVTRKGSKLRAAKREALIELAIELIAEKGLQACTFRALAAKAGTSTAPFTYEFGSRSKMLEAVVTRSYEVAWPDGFRAPESDPVERLFEGFAGMIRIEGDEAMDFVRALYEIYLHSPRDPELLETIKAIEDGIHPGYVELVRNAQAEDQVPADRDPEDLVDEIWAALDGINIARFSYPERFPQDRAEALFRDMFDRIIS
jgi:AcrR family transcriptional regulator